MCLAIPGRIKKIDAEKALVDFKGVSKEINISLVKAGIGDWVIVHAGFAIEKLHPQDSRLNPLLNYGKK